MLLKLYKIRVVILLISTLFLCHCTQNINAPIFDSSVQAKKTQSPYTKTTEKYLDLTRNQEGIEQQKTFLLAAGRALFDGQIKQCAGILAHTSDLTVPLRDEKNILLAQIDLLRDRPERALVKLRNVSKEESIPIYQQIQFHELLAQAYHLSDKPMQSISERIKLESLFLDEPSKKNNSRKLWLTLTHLSQAKIKIEAQKATNQSELQGWLQLALISHQYQANPKSLIAGINQWKTHFKHHPANNIVPNPLNSVVTKMINQPKQIALLLPLSGVLKGPGTAVQEGFMVAYKKNKDKVPMNIKTYDTSKGDVVTIYQAAIDDGADYVVGPLTKSQVAEIASLHHPVPTLLLNDSVISTEANAYLFGLSPSNEAVQVAIKAHNKGYTKALIIAPENAWGNEVSMAFSAQWEKQGARVIDTLLYASNGDLNKKMKNFLHITESQEREKHLKELLGNNIESVLSRRHDFDMIFLLAYPTKARQIMPLLNYYYAENVPIFSTANVYGGTVNALKNKDLDGIIFCDIPWVFSHEMGSRNWPEQFNSYNRLYALGKDSYFLATQLNHLMVFPGIESKKGNGILYLKHSQQVARVLAWGQFQKGLVHSLGETV